MAANRHLTTLRAEIHRQSQPGLTDEACCASDVAFHIALVDGAGNPVLSHQLTGAVETMQPLMNMITYTQRERDRIVVLHTRLADAIEGANGTSAEATLSELAENTVELGRSRATQRSDQS